MYKVTYSYQQGNPSGGFPKWQTKFKLYDGSLSADDLQSKIDSFLSDDCLGYRTNISVVSIEKI